MGILELSSGCILQTKSVVLHGQSKVIGNTRINFKTFSKLNVENLDLTIQISANAISHLKEGIELSNLNWDKEGETWNEINTKLLEIAEHKRLANWQTVSLLSSLSFTWVLIALALFCFYQYIIKKKFQLRQFSETPTPTKNHTLRPIIANFFKPSKLRNTALKQNSETY